MDNQLGIKSDKDVTIQGPDYSTNDWFWPHCVQAVLQLSSNLLVLIFNAISNHNSFDFVQSFSLLAWKLWKINICFFVESLLISMCGGLNFLKWFNFIFSSFSEIYAMSSQNGLNSEKGQNFEIGWNFATRHKENFISTMRMTIITNHLVFGNGQINVHSQLMSYFFNPAVVCHTVL